MLTLLQTTPALPADTPWWIVVLFMAAAGILGWLGAQVYPVWKEQQVMRFKAQLEREAAELEALREERREDIRLRREDERERVDAWKKIALWTEKTGETLIAINLRIDNIDRQLGNRHRTAPRQQLEGERGE